MIQKVIVVVVVGILVVLSHASEDWQIFINEKDLRDVKDFIKKEVEHLDFYYKFKRKDTGKKSNLDKNNQKLLDVLSSGQYALNDVIERFQTATVKQISHEDLQIYARKSLITIVHDIEKFKFEEENYVEKNDEWKFYKNTNCYNSKGADQISDHVGDVEECKSICQKSPICEGFVYGDPSKCELRKNIVIGECEYSSYWQMYVKPKISEQERKVLYDRLDILDEVIEIIREMTGNRKAVRPIISEQKSSSKKELKDYSADNDFTCPKSLPVFYNFGGEQYGCTLVSPDYKFTTGGLFKKVHTIDDQLFYLLPALTNFLKEEEITKSKEKRVYLELVLKFGNESAVKNYLEVPILNFEVAAFMKTEVILNLKNQPIQVNGHVQLINIELKTHYPSTWFGQHWGKCVVAIVLTGVMYWHHFYKKAKKTENDDDESQDEKETEDEKQSEDDDANLTLSDDIKNDGNIEVVASEV